VQKLFEGAWLFSKALMYLTASGMDKSVIYTAEKGSINSSALLKNARLDNGQFP
jgi:hypothetical protein